MKGLLSITYALLVASPLASCYKSKLVDQIDAEEISIAIVSKSRTVQSMENGKDGYTALGKTKDGQYYATVSIPNLGESGNFRNVKIGEAISVKVELWQKDALKHILVTELIPSQL